MNRFLILILHGAAAFQLLHAGVAFGVFDELHDEGQLSLQKLEKRTGLKKEPLRCLLFGLSSLRLIVKHPNGYSNASCFENVFRRKEWNVFRRVVLLQAQVVYDGQTDYVESLLRNRNVGVRRYPGSGDTIYERLSASVPLQRVFYDYMEAYSEYAMSLLMQKVDFRSDNHILDIGGGAGGNAIMLASEHPQLKIAVMELSSVKRLAEGRIRKKGLSQQIDFLEGDIFTDLFPGNQDSILFMHQLVIWGPAEMRRLLGKAYEALRDGGRVIICSSISDDDEKGPLMAGLDTVYFRAVAAGRGMVYPWKDYKRILAAVGFKNIVSKRLDTWTPHGVIIAYK